MKHNLYNLMDDRERVDDNNIESLRLQSRINQRVWRVGDQYIPIPKGMVCARGDLGGLVMRWIHNLKHVFGGTSWTLGGVLEYYNHAIQTRLADEELEWGGHVVPHSAFRPYPDIQSLVYGVTGESTLSPEIGLMRTVRYTGRVKLRLAQINKTYWPMPDDAHISPSREARRIRGQLKYSGGYSEAAYTEAEWLEIYTKLIDKLESTESLRLDGSKITRSLWQGYPSMDDAIRELSNRSDVPRHIAPLDLTEEERQVRGLYSSTGSGRGSYRYLSWPSGRVLPLPIGVIIDARSGVRFRYSLGSRVLSLPYGKDSENLSDLYMNMLTSMLESKGRLAYRGVAVDPSKFRMYNSVNEMNEELMT